MITLSRRWRTLELPTRIQVDRSTSTVTYGRFIAEPFERGQAVPIGNALRRVLLSSVEGAAVTNVKIEGVQHEFSSLAGVVEDVTDIVLNVKQLLVKVRTDEPRKIKIDYKGKGEVTGADILPDAMVEVVNKDLVLATLSEETTFRMEMEVRRGRGYVTAEGNDSEDREIGVIPIDSIYSPVRRVRYRTENTRVGQFTDYDKLILEIWTNGTVEPENALVEAAKIFRKHITPFVSYFEPLSAPEANFAAAEGTGPADAAHEVSTAASEPREDAAATLDEGLLEPISDLELSARARFALDLERMDTVRQLVGRDESALARSGAFGKSVMQELRAALKRRNLRFGMTEEEIEQRIAADEERFRAAARAREERAAALRARKTAAPATVPVVRTPVPPIAPAPPAPDLRSTPLGKTSLSVRARDACEAANLVTIGDLARLSEPQLLSALRLDQTAVEDVKELLGAFGLALTTEIPSAD